MGSGSGFIIADVFSGSSVIDAAPTRTPLFIGHSFDVAVAVLLLLLLCCCCVLRVTMKASDMWPVVIDMNDTLLIQQPLLHAYSHTHAHANLHTSTHTPR